MLYGEQVGVSRLSVVTENGHIQKINLVCLTLLQ